MKFVDRLRQQTNATSTATVMLGSSVVGFRTVAQAISGGDLAVGDEIPMCVESGTSWEISRYRVDSPTQLTRLEVLSSWTGGGEVMFPGGGKEIFCTVPAKYLQGVPVSALQAMASVSDTTRLLAINAAGELLTVTAAVLKAYTGGSAPAADVTTPSAPTNLASSSVTQAGFTITFTLGTDNVAVARSEWSLDGASWTGIGSAASFSVSGRTAGTTYTVRVRTVDTSGNVSTAATINVTTAVATGDTTAPTMSGSINVTNITSSGYTFSYATGSDNVAIDHYETSIDGGATWESNGLSLSRTVTGRPASTTDSLRVRAHDAAGNTSNVLSATATTAAAGPTMAQQYFATPSTLSTATYPADGTSKTMTESTTGSGFGYGSCGSLAIDIKKEDGTPLDPLALNVRTVWGRYEATQPPVSYNAATGAWDTGNVQYKNNGANTTGTSAAPNSNKRLESVNAASYPGKVRPDASMYFGGPVGKYKQWVLYPDGSFGIVQVNGVAQSLNLVAP